MTGKVRQTMRVERLPADPDRMPWLAETRPGRVSRMKTLMRGHWWVGPEDSKVVWRFEFKEDRDRFRDEHADQVIRTGYLGKLARDYRVQQEKEK